MALGQLIVAAIGGDIEAVEDIMARGVNVDQGDYDGRTVLHVAISEKRPEVVTLLLDKGAKWNVVDTWGMCPLQEALSIDELNIAEALCAKGAKLQTISVLALLDAACNEDKLRLLCTKAGVDINMADVDGKTALHHACALRMWRSCQNLLSLGANVNAADRCAAQNCSFYFFVMRAPDHVINGQTLTQQSAEVAASNVGFIFLQRHHHHNWTPCAVAL